MSETPTSIFFRYCLLFQNMTGGTKIRTRDSGEILTYVGHHQTTYTSSENEKGTFCANLSTVNLTNFDELGHWTNFDK